MLPVRCDGKSPVPPFQQPRAVGCYARMQCPQTKQITTTTTSAEAVRHIPIYREPQLPADLTDGFPERYMAKNDTAEDGCMHFVSPCQTILDSKIDLRGVRFLSFRNNFNKILGTPYNDNKPWEVDVWREAGVCIFNVVHVATDTRSSDVNNQHTYWGYKFEQLSTCLLYTSPSPRDS
eukprot:TRINITY_DN30941_c0_g1_i1.p1 TRINITY_DN30941_c0_g1~~TRINITY_DN30941_c0_g1_i1.p1  ORF type:complete len:178 (-),score=30.59 TRINITY_DN30941_c0_g1_i1:162-695(-)